MKILYRMMFLASTLLLAGIFTNCSDDEGGAPRITYVRVTDPASSDSLLIAASQGQMVAIMGENLQNTKEVWFNDQQAELTTPFITSRSIITRVPSPIPQVITNKLKLVFSNGDSLIYDFAVDISQPLITRMKSEYVNTGDVAVFYGNYFYEPITVTFTGGVEGEVVSVEDEILQVEVPDGVQPGPVTIATNFGVTETDLWFRDNRNIIASFDGPLDPATGVWHGSNFVVASDGNISNINGKFIRMNQSLGAWAWFELYVGVAGSDVSLELKNIPADAFANPEKYSLKFELNTLASLTGARIHMYFGPTMPTGRDNAKYIWEPNIDTGGDWETVSIPWQSVLASNTELVYNPSGYGTSIHFSGPSAVFANFGLDNMRVVPNQ